MVQKHAYLVMAHDNFYILRKLLQLLDVPENDIFLHVDKKVRSFDFAGMQKICKRARVLYPKKRIDVRWGTQSQVLTELLLFQTAYKNGPYAYYHVLSGVDLPLKTQDEIQTFFSENDKNYIHYYETLSDWDYRRVSRYHGIFGIKWLDDKFSIVQDKLKVDRLKKCKLTIKRGYNWASLTHQAVELLLQHVSMIKRMTRFSLCADEIFKQTVLLSAGCPNIDTNYLRFVDWSAGGSHPHVFTLEDLPRLLESDMLFARKFSETSDREVVDRLYEHIKCRQEENL